MPNENSVYERALAVADTLRNASARAADLMEQLATENDKVRSSASGVLPDGTPVSEMLEELKESKAENARMRDALRRILHLANTPVSKFGTAGLKQVRDLATKATA